MSNRDDRAWAGYDNWLLKGSGVDDNTPEVFAEYYIRITRTLFLSIGIIM
mgnify:CR=1 FL=1